VDKEKEGNQNSVITLMEMNETECQLKSGQVPHAIDGTQRNEITAGTSLLLFPREVHKSNKLNQILNLANGCSKPWELLEEQESGEEELWT
jgi:hypothetical protein